MTTRTSLPLADTSLPAENQRITGHVDAVAREPVVTVATGWDDVGNCSGLDRVKAAPGSVVPRGGAASV